MEPQERVFCAADRLKCKKVAFGHHKDDIAQTMLMTFFSWRDIYHVPQAGVVRRQDCHHKASGVCGRKIDTAVRPA